jgi:hypothetical protein
VSVVIVSALLVSFSIFFSPLDFREQIHAACFEAYMYCIAAGGIDFQFYSTAIVEKYDVNTGLISVMSNMTIPLTTAGVAISHDAMYLFGGNALAFDPFNAMLIFNATTQT